LNLEDAQAQVRDVNPYYVDMLTWKQQGNKRRGILITVVPKKPLSDLSFNAVKRVFKRLGGKFVSHAGQAWFELVVLEECCLRKGSGFLSPQGKGLALSPLSISPAPGTLKQTEAKIASLVRAGRELREED